MTSLLVMGACASGAPVTSSQKLVWAFSFPPTGSWAVETDDATDLTQAGVAEPLVRLGKDGELLPGLATSWKRADPTHWVFTLRSGVKFQNGTAFNAAAVVKSLNYILHVATPAPALSSQDMVSVSALAGDSVQVETAQPNPLVPMELSTGSSIILAPTAYIGDDRINPIGTGTGPFTMTASNLPQSISLKANPNYWGGAPGLTGAEVRYIQDDQTRSSLLQTGEVQLSSTLSAVQLSLLKKDSKVSTVERSIPRYTSLYLNNKRAPLTDLRVRQAIQSAIDLNAITTNVLQGMGTPAVGPFRKDDPWAPTSATAPAAYNVEHAKSLLAAAGVTPSTVHLTLQTYPNRPELPLVATAIQGMLAKVGLSVQIQVRDSNAVTPDWLSGNYDMALGSRNYLWDAPEPLYYLQADYGCAGNDNISQFCNPSIDSKLAGLASNDNVKSRYAVYASVAEQLQQNAVDVFLYNPLQTAAMTTRLKGFSIYFSEQYYLTRDLSLAA